MEKKTNLEYRALIENDTWELGWLNLKRVAHQWAANGYLKLNLQTMEKLNDKERLVVKVTLKRLELIMMRHFQQSFNFHKSESCLLIGCRTTS